MKHWRLVTNAAFNTTDQERWDDEVVPLFKALGFDEVDRCEREADDALGVLIGSACKALASHVGFIVGEL